jgi:hypothetical protein
MNAVNRGSFKRIGIIVAVGPLLGGLPFNLAIFLIPFSYVLGVIPALLTGIFSELWLTIRRYDCRPIKRFHFVLIGCVFGFSACLLTSLIFLMTTQSDVFNVYELQSVGQTEIGLALLFSAMGGFWSAVLLPWVYRSYVSMGSSQPGPSLTHRTTEHSGAAPA